jgi:phosphate:Na+ symporter
MVVKILQFAGSLCFLLYGMKLMSDGIQKNAGKKLQAALDFMTGNRFAGLLTGCILTMIIQSSGATTVMVVSFVNAALITLEQSIGVIFGANIGTTITAWIVALFGFSFKIESFAVPLFGIGFLLTVVQKWHKEGIGQAVMGFGLLFIGLGWLSHMFELGGGFTEFLTMIEGHGELSLLLAAVIGLFFTALIHSSSAMTAIVITMAYNKMLSWEFSAALVIGSNIGSTIDSVMAAIGAKANAKRTSLVHVLFNCTTAVLAFVFFRPLLAFVDWIVPGPVYGSIQYHIAMLHTVFNVIGTIVFIPWTKQIASLMTRIIPDDKEAAVSVYHLEFSEKIAAESPEACVIQAQKEIGVFADVVVEMFDGIQMGFMKRDESFIAEHFERIAHQEDYTDQMHEQLTRYLIKCSRLDISEYSQNNISVMLQISEDLESMGDECLNVAMQIKKSVEKKLPFKKEDMDRLLPYVELARQLLYFIHKNISHKLNQDQMDFAREIENQIDSERHDLKKIARERLETGANVKAELLYIDIVRQIEKIGDRCFSIAGELAKN